MGSISKTSAAAFAVLVALGAAGCGGSDDDSSSTGSRDLLTESETDAPADDAGGDADAGEGAVTEDAATAGSSATAAPLGLDALGRAIAVEAGVTIGTPNMRQAVDDTLATVRRGGASVFNADVNIGDELEDGDVRGSARIVVKVAPTGLDPLIADLDGVTGTLIGRTQTSDDVTDQLVDLDIRIRVERNAIERFESLLAEATDFEDVVAIERVIAERTVSLEQLLASERNIDQRVELSTLTIDLMYQSTPSVQPVENAGDDGIGDAFARGWDALVGALFIVGFVLAVAAPFLLIAAAVGAVVVLIARRRRRHTARRSATPTFDPPSPAVGGEDEVADGTVGEGEGRPHAGVGDHLG